MLLPHAAHAKPSSERKVSAACRLTEGECVQSKNLHSLMLRALPHPFRGSSLPEGALARHRAFARDAEDVVPYKVYCNFISLIPSMMGAIARTE